MQSGKPWYRSKIENICLKILYRARDDRPEGVIMLWTIYVMLCALWLFALFTDIMLGGFSHILLVMAISVMFYRVYQGTKVGLQ